RERPRVAQRDRPCRGAVSGGDRLRQSAPGAGAWGNHGPAPVRSDLPYGEAKQALLAAFEVRYLADLIERCEGNISRAAREADMDRKHLRDVLRKHGLVAGEDP